jgi:hypothetical protein
MRYERSFKLLAITTAFLLIVSYAYAGSEGKVLISRSIKTDLPVREGEVDWGEIAEGAFWTAVGIMPGIGAVGKATKFGARLGKMAEVVRASRLTRALGSMRVIRIGRVFRQTH